MLAAAALLASILVGPEIGIPARSVPAYSAQTRVAALANGDFLVTNTHNFFSALKVDGTTGKPGNARLIEDKLVYPQLYAIGNRALAIWTTSAGFAWVVLDADAQPVARGSMAASILSYDVTPLGGSYLVVWAEPQRVVATFIDADGVPRGSNFTVVRDALSAITIASDGTRALVAGYAEGEGLCGQIETAVITSSRSVTRGGALATCAFNIRAAWDGSEYVLAWTTGSYESYLWLGWTDAAGHPIGTPLEYANILGVPQLVATDSGLTMFLHSFDSRNKVVQLGRGGTIIDDLHALPVTFGHFSDPTVQVAFNGRVYCVVAENDRLLGAVTDLATTVTPIPLAFSAPEQGFATLGVGDHQAFLAWWDDGQAPMVARFRDDTFFDPLPLSATGPIVMDGDRAVLLAGKTAVFVDERGQIATTLAVNDPQIGTNAGFSTGRRLADGSFLGIMVMRSPYDYFNSLGIRFDASGVSHVAPFVSYLTNIATDGNAVAWVDDRKRAFVARHDPVTNRLGRAIDIDDDAGSEVAIADDGQGHALVITHPEWGPTYNFTLVDLTQGTFARIGTAPYHWTASVVWTGTAYVVATQRADLIEITPDGTIGQPIHIAVPYPTTSVQLARGPYGAFLLYSRPAPDRGLGDAYRMFVRRISAPRHHAAAP